jgi:hypothetical protein
VQNFMAKSGGVSEDEFRSHGRSVVAPGINYYVRMYNEAGGELYDLKLAYTAASVFDPRVLKSITIERAKVLVDGLKGFEFRTFTDQFIQDLKNELERLKHMADADYNWDDVEGASAYNEKLKKKIAKQRNLREDDPSTDSREGRYRTWEDDPGEQARRIWIWWLDRFDRFSAFAKAARLIVLIQTSSASVERLFSKLKLLVDAIGESQLEETVETRLFVQYNLVRYGVYQSPPA